MAYKINGTEVINDSGNLVNYSAFTMDNDNGQFEVQDSSPMVGTVAGFVSGGEAASPPGPVNTVDKFPFASDSTITDVGDLITTRYSHGSASSSISGYNMCGFTQPGSSNIEKFSFFGSFRTSSVGNSTSARGHLSGVSSIINGYTMGGNPGGINTIDKFPFSLDSNATDVGDLTVARRRLAGHSSTVSGYVSGGYANVVVPTTTVYNTIDKFPFATDSNATDVGDLSQTRYTHAGHSSTISGYVSGGYNTIPGSSINTIEKFPFATNTNASSVGNLTQARSSTGGLNSLTFGYTFGGTTTSPPAYVNTIDKFPFSTDTNASDVGDLTQTRAQAAGQQD